MSGFELERLSFHYGPAAILEHIQFQVSAPGLLAIVGPNGAGKSTLLGVLAGLKRGYTGTCRFEQQEIRSWNRRALSRRVAFVPQSLKLEFPFTAEQVVLMGRAPYGTGLFESDEDWRVVENAMAATDTLAFRGRDFRSLSGGEAQRVVLASALAQDPDVLLLDEPTTFLDLEHQLSIFQVLRRQTARGLLAIVVTHDLNLTLNFATRLIALKQGRLVADDEPHRALTAAAVEEIFRVQAQVIARDNGRSWLAFGE